ncbi:MAG: radical SAM protein [Proteiniphilum sp.]|jgi:MoaA/NifB/PqqE/SkfB family radical SAM enzyme|nr:radical SAM protein [Proteiniphilum sp.]
MKPNYIAAFLTLACPRKCPYCLNGQHGDTGKYKISPAAQWVPALNRLKSDIPITLHGGEPLCHPEFYEIVNHIHPDKYVDMLTTFPFGVAEFRAKIKPERFRNPFIYPSIRVTHHFDNMNLEETVSNVMELKNSGYSVGLYFVNHPAMKAQIADALAYCKSKQLPQPVLKPYLGRYMDRPYGNYRYPQACFSPVLSVVKCRSSNFLIAPDGNIYGCHKGLLEKITSLSSGSLFGEYTFNHPLDCPYYGSCNTCDVQYKYDKTGRWGFSAVTITGSQVKTSHFDESDWVIPHANQG